MVTYTNNINIALSLIYIYIYIEREREKEREGESMILIPASITPHCHTGALFDELLYGHDTESHDLFKDRSNDQICDNLSRSTHVPKNTLDRANHMLKPSRP